MRYQGKLTNSEKKQPWSPKSLFASIYVTPNLKFCSNAENRDGGVAAWTVQDTCWRFDNMWEVVVAERTRNRVTTCGFREGNRKRKQKVSAVCYSESAIVKGSSSHFFLPFLPIELISCSLTLFCAFSLRGLWEILDETTLPCQRSRLFIESLTLLQEFSLYLSFLVLLRYVQLVTKVSSYVVLQGKSFILKNFHTNFHWNQL